nr:MAG TPA: hypothetical protein [Herelleviridae sp.]
MSLFQHTAARRRLGQPFVLIMSYRPFQHTAARRRLGNHPDNTVAILGFNTQPPEGGWAANSRTSACHRQFQHTAARRRLVKHGSRKP